MCKLYSGESESESESENESYLRKGSLIRASLFYLISQI